MHCPSILFHFSSCIHPTLSCNASIILYYISIVFTRRPNVGQDHHENIRTCCSGVNGQHDAISDSTRTLRPQVNVINSYTPLKCFVLYAATFQYHVHHSPMSINHHGAIVRQTSSPMQQVTPAYTLRVKKIVLLSDFRLPCHRLPRQCHSTFIFICINRYDGVPLCTAV